MTVTRILGLRQPAPVWCEFTFSRGETRRLANHVRQLAVRQGCAWISYAQEDIILHPGDCINLRAAPSKPMIVTALGRGPLVLGVASLKKR